MHGVDTNVIVRYLTGDDPRQADKARAVIGQRPIFVPRTILLAVEWVLRGVYGFSAAQVIPALRALAGLPGVAVEDGKLVARRWTGPRRASTLPMPCISRRRLAARVS